MCIRDREKFRKKNEELEKDIPVMREVVESSWRKEPELTALKTDLTEIEMCIRDSDPSKRADVKAFYIKGMVKDGQGEPFNAWVKPNFERNKSDDSTPP